MFNSQSYGNRYGTLQAQKVIPMPRKQWLNERC
jgi:hypothetical protein